MESAFTGNAKDLPRRYRSSPGGSQFEARQAKARNGGPTAGSRLLSILSILLDLALDLGWIEANPVRTVKKLRHKGEGFHTWTEDEIAALPGALDPWEAVNALPWSFCWNGSTERGRAANESEAD